MAMTKKDYVLIADAINNALSKDGDVISGLADAFASQNPRFDKQIFMEACLPKHMRIHDNSAKGYVVPEHFTDVKVGDYIKADGKIVLVTDVESPGYWEFFEEHDELTVHDSMPFCVARPGEVGEYWVTWREVEHA